MNSIRKAALPCFCLTLTLSFPCWPLSVARPSPVSPGHATWSTARPQDGPPQARSAPWDLVPGQRCVECHAEVANEARVHGPVREDRCDLCHLTPDSKRHLFIPPTNMGAVCSECHPLPMRGIMHDPVKKGECLSCHKPHQSHDKYLFRASSEKELCSTCHEPQAGINKKNLHGPVALGLCTVCHAAHSSPNQHLLRSESRDNCLACHEDMRLRLEASPALHGPVAEGCTQCHDSHASDHPFQLLSVGNELCTSCHEPFMERLAGMSVVHDALFSGEGCMHCHDPHAAVLPKMLKKPVGELCLSCHADQLQRPDGTTFPGLGEKLESSTYLHGPVRDLNCTACHDPHGSQTAALLRQPYPKTFYAPFSVESYGLCFGCHDSAGFLVEKTETHTKFRDKDMNLHFVHVHKKDKGRTCRACHETHGSILPFQIAESASFGAWEIPINFEITPEGGSCSPGCHTPQTYSNKRRNKSQPLSTVLDASLPAAGGK